MYKKVLFNRYIFVYHFIFSYLYISKVIKMSTIGQNGKVVKTVATATENAKTTKTNVTAKNTKQEFETKKIELNAILNSGNAEQRIKNLEVFQKMADKHKFLKEKRDTLTAFMVSRDGFKEKLMIMNDNNESFEITNGTIISELLDICSDKLDEMIRESEIKISSFQI